jgi:uncharacterized membrane protein
MKKNANVWMAITAGVAIAGIFGFLLVFDKVAKPVKFNEKKKRIFGKVESLFIDVKGKVSDLKDTVVKGKREEVDAESFL